MVEHYIQRRILECLTRYEQRRFSELKPPGLENNSFMYHLTQLQKRGYITKSAMGYQLSAKGLQYVDNLQARTQKPHIQPKVIAIIILEHPDGSYMLVRRKQQPYIGEHMFYSGSQHFGESFLEQPVRELTSLGLDVGAMTYRGLADIRINHEADILTHVIGHIHTAHYDGALPHDTDRYDFIWHTFNDADTLPMLAGTREIHQQLQKSGILAIEINQEIAQDSKRHPR